MTDLLARLMSYADTTPLHLLTPARIQRDLWAIAGQRHAHRRSIGSDACLLCGQDEAADIHTEEKCNTAQEPMRLAAE